MTGRWLTGAGAEHDAVIQHKTRLAGTACQVFMPPRLLKERRTRRRDQICTDRERNHNDLKSIRRKKLEAAERIIETKPIKNIKLKTRVNIKITSVHVRLFERCVLLATQKLVLVL